MSLRRNLIFILAVAAILIFGSLIFNFANTKENKGSEFGSGSLSRVSAEIPALSLPFKISDIDTVRGGVNPLGVVRFSKDEEAFGHSGIDMPLFQGSDIIAVADGEVVQILSSEDPWGGMDIFHLLSETADGEGWGFIYAHVTPRSGLKVGDEIKRGEIIATKTAPAGFTAHFQLSKLFNNYEYIRDIKCWPDNLSDEASAELFSWWNVHKESQTLIDGWDSVSDEGRYQFRGLLDKTQFPEGPQLCYPLGTDAR